MCIQEQSEKVNSLRPILFGLQYPPPARIGLKTKAFNREGVVKRPKQKFVFTFQTNEFQPQTLIFQFLYFCNPMLKTLDMSNYKLNGLSLINKALHHQVRIFFFAKTQFFYIVKINKNNRFLSKLTYHWYVFYFSYVEKYQIATFFFSFDFKQHGNI